MKVLIVSNGYGEDLIATTLGSAWQEQAPDAEIMAMPLVGNGHYYDKGQVKVLARWKLMPSGGFIRSLRDLFADIRAGLIGQLKAQWRCLRQEQAAGPVSLCVGDVFALVMGAWGAKGPVYFLPTAKSQTFMGHSKLEYWLIRRLATKSYPRDEATCREFEAKGLAAAYVGNPMMDGLADETPLDWPVQDGQVLVGILPGSRQEAMGNLAKILDVIAHLAEPERYAFVVAKAPSVTLSEGAVPGWRYEEAWVHEKTGVRVGLSDQFKAVIRDARLVIGLAGTANEQAVFMGKTVLAFTGTGPQSTRQRFEEQQRLLGPSLRLLSGETSQALAKAIQAVRVPDPVEVTPESSAASTMVADMLGQLGQPS